MGTVAVHYERGVDANAQTGRGLSGFWGDCPVIQSLEDAGRAFGHIEMGTGIERLTAAGVSGGYSVAMQGTGDFGTDAQSGGVLLMETAATADDEVLAQWGGGIAGMGAFQISDGTTASKEKQKLWFECVFDVDSVTAGDSSFFIGLCEGLTPAADDVITDAHAIEAARDLIGFFKKDADGTLVDVIYQKGSQTFATLIDGGITLVADTIKRLGFKYDPTRPAAEQVTFYDDGVPMTTFVTATQIGAADPGSFPDAVLMNPTFNIKTDASTLMQLNIHTWGCYQLHQDQD